MKDDAPWDRVIYVGESSKPYHIGIHWIALPEYSQMCAHVPGVQ